MKKDDIVINVINLRIQIINLYFLIYNIYKKKKRQKMNYVMYNVIKFKESIDCDNLNNRCKKREKDFSRNRKITPKDLILYTLNNRGKTTKMELYDFIQEYNIDEVSTPALLKQRMKLNENIFKDLNKESLIRFMENFHKKLKHIKGIFQVLQMVRIVKFPILRKLEKDINQ